MWHTHISGLEGIKTVLYVLAGMGVINLLMMHLAAGTGPLAKFAASYCNLYGLTV